MVEFERAEALLKADPEVKQLTIPNIDEDISNFQTILSSGTESEAHDFLSHKTYFFNDMLRLYSHTAVWSKVKFGHEYECDFAFFELGSYGVEWRFMELESPSMQLTKKSGEPTAQFNHALNQIRDWDEWIRENISYANRWFPLIDFPLYYIVAGRRSQIDELSRKRLKRIQQDFRGNLLLKTYDRFVSNAETVKYLVRDDKGGNWPVPMKAFSHNDFMNRRPAHSFDALDNDRTQSRTLLRQDDRRREREWQRSELWSD
jgi:hypothetical protein